MKLLTRNISHFSQKMNRTETIKSIIKNILYNSTAQAILNLIQTRNLIIKVFLTFCIFFTLTASSYFVISNVLNYFKYEVTTMSRHVFEMPTTFPKITFCNFNQFTTEFGLEFLKEIDQNSSFPLSVFNRNQTNGLNQVDKRQLYENLNTLASAKMLENKTLKKFQKKFTHSLDDILLGCLFNNQVCTVNDFVTDVDLFFGKCFSFNAPSNASLKKTSIAGPLNGLTIDLYLNFHEDLTEFNSFTGGLGGLIRIENNSYQSDHDYDGLYIETGKSYSISVHRQFESNLPRPYSNCEIENEKPRSGLKNSDLYKMILNSPYQYTQAFCLKQCSQMIVVNKCNCSNPFYLSLIGARTCEYKSEIDCSQRVFSNRSILQAECIDKCPLECNSTNYRTTMSSLQLLGDLYVGYLKENKRLTADFVTKPINSQTARESVTRLNIFYESLSYEISREQAKLEIVDLLSNIGGTLSLFLGISLLSFCELVEVIIEIIFILRPKRVTCFQQKTSNNRTKK